MKLRVELELGESTSLSVVKMNEIARLLGVPVVTELNGSDFTVYPGNSAKFVVQAMKEHFRKTDGVYKRGIAADVIARQKAADGIFILMVNMRDCDGNERSTTGSAEV